MNIYVIHWLIYNSDPYLFYIYITASKYSLFQARSDGILVTRLTIKQVTNTSFKPYTIVAENSIGETTYEMKLSKGK